MEQLLDKEYTDPSWCSSEKDVGGDFDIFSLCEFTKLTNSEIATLLKSYNLQAQTILKTEFTVAYNYCFQGWFENREFVEKSEPVGKTSELTPEEICNSCDHVDPWKCFINEPKEKFVDICTKKLVSNICTICNNCKKGRLACTTCGIVKYHHPGERGKIQCRWCDGTGYADYGGSHSCHACRGRGWMPCKSFKNQKETKKIF